MFSLYFRAYPLRFGKAVRDLLPLLLTEGRGKPDPPPLEFSGLSWVAAADDCLDCWPEARLSEVVHYLRGSKLLDLPPHWKVAFPKRA